MVKEYPVGTVVTIIYSDNFKYLIGTDATITGGLREVIGPDDEVWLGYELDITEQGELDFNPPHEYLKLKRPPQQDDEQEAFKSFMDKVMKPVSLPEEELT